MQCEVDHIFAIVTVILYLGHALILNDLTSFYIDIVWLFFWFSIKPSITTVPSKNFAEKNIHSERYKSKYIKPSQLDIHKKIRLRQNAVPCDDVSQGIYPPHCT